MRQKAENILLIEHLARQLWGELKEADARQPLAFSVRNIMMHSWSLTDCNDHRWDQVLGEVEPQLIIVQYYSTVQYNTVQYSTVQYSTEYKFEKVK